MRSPLGLYLLWVLLPGVQSGAPPTTRPHRAPVLSQTTDGMRTAFVDQTAMRSIQVSRMLPTQTAPTLTTAVSPHSDASPAVAGIALLLLTSLMAAGLAIRNALQTKDQLLAPLQPFGAPPAPNAQLSLLAASGARQPRPLTPGDLVVVFGASGGLGQLVVQKLATRKKYRVRAVVRNVAKAQELFKGYDVEIVKGATTDVATVGPALVGAAAVIVTTGTTAFPTKRWFDGDTPRAIDYQGVKNVVDAADGALKRFILVTSIGLERKDQMPFKILNLFGVIDEKRKGELEVIAGSATKGYDYQLVRPGRLVGGPYTNPDLAKLTQADISDDCQAVDILRGDAGLNDCGRWSCSEAIVEMLDNLTAINLALSICNKKGDVPASSAIWQRLLDQAA